MTIERRALVAYVCEEVESKNVIGTLQICEYLASVLLSSSHLQICEYLASVLLLSSHFLCLPNFVMCASVCCTAQCLQVPTAEGCAALPSL